MESIPKLQGFDGPSVLSLQRIPSIPNVFILEKQNLVEIFRDDHLFWWFGRPIAGRKCVEQINRLTAVYKQQYD